MKANGIPVMVTGGASKVLQREFIGGKEGRHDEQWLQKLLYHHPSCIPMDQIESGFSDLVSICMELPLSCGSLDNLFMTPNGDIIIVEAKLFRNPQARREVVAQVLDYASSLFGMNYTALESAVLKASFDDGNRPSSLYEMFADADTLDEPEFIDAVNMNLKNGRIVVLVIGDGIRSDAEDLVVGLQSHAGFHFTFALVELTVFQTGNSEELLIVPRTLAKTFMIERGIVRINDQRSEVVSIQIEPDTQSAGVTQSISSEQFFDKMKEINTNLPDVLKSFISRLSNLDVYPEFKHSLIFSWDTPSGKTVNMGYIMKGGKVWTDSSHWKEGDPLIAQKYIEELAECFKGEVVLGKAGKRYVAVGGKAPDFEIVMDKLDGWFKAIESFQNRIRKDIDRE